MAAASLVVKIFADISDFEKNLPKADRALVKSLNRMEDAGKRLAMKVTLPLTALGAGMVKLASDAEESASKMDAVFGKSAESMNRWIGQVQSTIPATRKELQDMTSGIQDLLVPLGMAPAAAQRMTQQIAVLASDLGSFNNMPTDQALERIRSGLVGQYEPLLKFGVALSASTVKAEALRMGLIHGKEELNANARAQAAFSLILKGTTAAHGDAARTATSTANVMKFFARDVKDLGTSFGQILIPAVTPAISKLRDLAKDLNGASLATKQAAVALGVFAAAAPIALIAIANITKALVYVRSIQVSIAATTLAMTGPWAAAAAAVGLVGLAIYKSGENARTAEGMLSSYQDRIAKFTNPKALVADMPMLQRQFDTASADLANKRTQRTGLGTGGDAGTNAMRRALDQDIALLEAKQRAIADMMVANSNAFLQLTKAGPGGASGGSGSGGGTPASGAMDTLLDRVDLLTTAYEQLSDRGESTVTVTRQLISASDQLAASLAKVAGRSDDASLAQANTIRKSLGAIGATTMPDLPASSWMANNAPRRLSDSVSGVKLGAVNIPKPVVDIPKKLTDVQQAMQAGFVQVSVAIGDTLASRLSGLLGGRGTGAQIGGSILGAAGGAAAGALVKKGVTSMLGLAGNAMLPVVGGILGTAVGGLIGGLFDRHKKKTDQSAEAMERLAKSTDRVSESLTNLPSGFKVTLARFNATRGAGAAGGIDTSAYFNGSNSGGSMGPIWGTPLGTGASGSGAPTIVIAGPLNIRASNPAEFYRELTRTAEYEATRGGTAGLQVQQRG